MHINKEIIHDNNIVEKGVIQITLDEDCNISDAKPDVENIIRECGNVRIDNSKLSGNKAEIKGTLIYELIYCGKENGVKVPVRMEGDMLFNELVNFADNVEECSVYCKPILDDITIKTINSRKINIKAIITLEVICEKNKDICLGCEIEQPQEELMLKARTQNVNYSCLTLNLRDNLRIRENLLLPSDKAPMGEIVWYDICVKSFNTRLLEEGITINGEIEIFVMYKNALNDERVEWYETTSSYEGKLELNGCNADMIGFIRYSVISKNIEVKSNTDGENMEFLAELVLDLNMKAYEEKEKKIISDMYSPISKLSVVSNNMTLRHLVIRSQNQCKTEGKVKLKTGDKGHHICNVSGAAHIDDITVTDKGLSVDGAIFADILYICEDEELGNAKVTLPYSAQIFIPIDYDKYEHMVMDDKIEYEVEISAINLRCQSNGRDEVIVKGNVVLEVICFEKVEVESVDECDDTNVVADAYINEPGMVGYIAAKDECLWDIAKRYHTTVDIIKACNKNLTDKCDEEYVVERGNKLLLMKAAR